MCVHVCVCVCVCVCVFACACVRWCVPDELAINACNSLIKGIEQSVFINNYDITKYPLSL